MTTAGIAAAPDRDPTIYPDAHKTARWANGFTPAAFCARAGALARQAVWHLWVNRVAAWAVWPGRVRRWMLCRAGLDVRTNGVSAHCHFTDPNVYIGQYSYVNEGFFGDARGGIHIGERVAVGPHVMVISSAHKIGKAHQRCGAHLARRVIIGDGSAIGGGSAIHSGVRLGTGVVVSAGSVVMRSAPANSLISGVPGKIVKTYDE